MAQTLMVTLSELYAKLKKDRAVERAEQRQQASEMTVRQVPQLVQEMLQKGETPTDDRIRELLGPGVAKNMRLIRRLIKELQEQFVERGYAVIESGGATARIFGHRKANE